MPLETQAEKGVSNAWQAVADSINHLSNHERKKIRHVLSMFMHDMKHTLGLIANANELIRRDIQSCPEKHKSDEMISIIHNGAQQLDEYFDTIVESCSNRIDVGED